MSRWFRHYAGMMRDDKFVRVAMAAKQPVERVVWVWGAILESAGEIDDGGRYELDPAEAAYFLRTDVADIVSITDGLESLGRTIEGRVANWGKRQFQSDRSAERQKAYRDRQKPNRSHNGDGDKDKGDGEVTAASRHGDGAVTHHRQSTDTEERKKENKEDPASAGSTKYAFEEGIIRLTDRDFQKLKETYTYIDVRAEIMGASEWLNQQGPERWYHALKAVLAKKNREAKERADAKARGGTSYNEEFWRGKTPGIQ